MYIKKNRQHASDVLFDCINYLAMLLVLIIVVYPLIYILSASFSDPASVSGGEMWLWPVGFSLEGYVRMLGYSEIGLGYSNTIVYTAAGTLTALAVTLPAAYTLSRKDFVGRGVLTVLVLITMFFSGGLIATYINIKNLGLLDSQLLMIINGACSAYNLIVSRTFFSSIPPELQEAAQIDGCSNFRLFFKIILPVSKPIIAVMAMYYAIGHWNDYFTAMIYLTDRAKYPLQLFLREILIQSRVSADLLADVELAESIAAKARISSMIKYCSIIISTIPLLVVYPFFQRFFVKGVMIGAVKG